MNAISFEPDYWCNRFVDEFDSILKSFEPNELAYLALTSKPEFVIRDRCAWHFQKRSPELLFAREHKRIDLAIMSEGDLKLCVEFKAKSAFNFFNNSLEKNSLVEMINGDLQKNGRTKTISILLCVEALDIIQDYLSGIIKYSKGHNEPMNHETTFTSIESFLKDNHFKVKGKTYDIGSFREIRAKLHVYALYHTL